MEKKKDYKILYTDDKGKRRLMVYSEELTLFPVVLQKSLAKGTLMAFLTEECYLLLRREIEEML